MRNLDMRAKVTSRMQALLYDPTLMMEKEGAEQPPCGTLNPSPSWLEERDEDSINMHEDTPQQCILENTLFPLLSQEKDGNESPNFDSDAAPR